MKNNIVNSQRARSVNFLRSEIIIPISLTFIMTVSIYFLRLSLNDTLMYILGGVLFAAYSLLPDAAIVFMVFFSNVIFLDFLFKGHDLFEVILPASFLVLIFRRLIHKDLNINQILKYSWPFLLFFSIGFYWFTQDGTLPVYFFKKDIHSEGNFTLYYNIFLNMLAFLLPFMTSIDVNSMSKLLRILLLVFLAKAFFLTLYVISAGSFYVPFFTPYFKELTGSFSIEGSRIGEISSLSYLIILYVLFWGDEFHKILKIMIISLAIGLNLVLGGGRLDLLSSIFVIVFARFFKSQQGNFIDLFRASGKLIIVPILIFSYALLFGYFFPANQERFSELINPSKAYEKRVGGDRSRIEMWRYVIQEGFEKPYLGHGISQHSDIESYDTGAEGLVATGKAHNKYLSLFYSFGLIGLGLFLFSSKLFFDKLWKLKKTRGNNLWGFLLIMYFASYFIEFLLSGRSVGQEYMFYFFIGYVLSYQLLPNNGYESEY